MLTRLRFSPVNLPWFVAVLTITWLAAVPAQAQELPAKQFKDGITIREAFRDVVRDARHYTVEVRANGKQVALGTIIEADGSILTKASQLGSENLEVVFSTGKRSGAVVVGVYPEFDLALLKVEATNLPVVEWSTDFDLDLGRWLATPGTGELPVAVGVVAVKPRPIPLMRGLLGVTFEDAPDGGARVKEVVPESGAEKAGVRVGDVILMVNGKSIKTGTELRESIQEHRPGEGVLLRIDRDGQLFDVIATLGNPESRQNNKSVMQNSWGPTLSIRRAGFTSALQHDTVLAAEQCGGPIVDLTGKAIGINIARAGRTESFTLLVNQISPVVADLKSGKFAPLKPEKQLQLLAESPESNPADPGRTTRDTDRPARGERVKEPQVPERLERRNRPGKRQLVPGGGTDRFNN